MTNTANARHPRKRKLPTAAELHAELMKIQNEQRATFDEARTILQTNHRYATPQAINAKLRQVSRG
jgi:hypothetical protein